jgi:Sulfatase
MIEKLRRYPFFLLLLHIFFVVHGLNAAFSYIPLAGCLVLMAWYEGAALLLFMIFRLLFKNTVAAALFSSFLMAFYLFFGAIHDFLGDHHIPHRYTLALAGFLLIGIVLVVRRRGDWRSFVLFLNVLFLVYLLVDTGGIIGKAIRPGAISAPSYPLRASADGCDTCPRPDIYFLIFDEYGSSDVLEKVYHYDNGSLDSFLRHEGFSIQRRSRANYDMTPFSIASLLNASYLNDIGDPDSLDLGSYKKINLSVKHAAVPAFLSSRGYRIVNYSPFDLDGQPSIQHQPFIFSGTKLITNGTLPHYFEDELNWVIGKWLIDRHIIGRSRISQPYFDQIYENNERMLRLAEEESVKASSQPRFVYVHVFLPHRPYVIDSLGRWNNTNAAGMNDSTIREYLGYLGYTNARAKTLVSAIKRNTAGKAVILFMSDHGFKYRPNANDRMPASAFCNQNAVFFPDGDYSALYDSISGVNQFRVVLNKLFRQKFPLLKDSVIFLRDSP